MGGSGRALLRAAGRGLPRPGRAALGEPSGEPAGSADRAAGPGPGRDAGVWAGMGPSGMGPSGGPWPCTHTPVLRARVRAERGGGAGLVVPCARPGARHWPRSAGLGAQVPFRSAVLHLDPAGVLQVSKASSVCCFDAVSDLVFEQG